MVSGGESPAHLVLWSMSEARPHYEVLPFPVGEGPFHIKGVAYRGHLDYVEKYVRGGARACREGFQDPALQKFFEQQFLASSWYDVYPLIAAGNVCANIAGMEVDKFLRVRARYQAEKDIAGVYKIFARLASAEGVTTRLTRMSASYFDFGADEIRQLAPKHIEAVRKGVPTMVVPWSAPVVETYVDYALKINGAKDYKIEIRPPRRDGTAHGIETMTMGMEISWG